MRAATGAGGGGGRGARLLELEISATPGGAWNTTTGAFDVPMLAARCLARRALASARTAGAAARAAPHAPRRFSTVNFTFVDFEGESFAVTGTEGETVLEAALAADIEVEAARVLPRPSARARAARRTRRAPDAEATRAPQVRRRARVLDVPRHFGAGPLRLPRRARRGGGRHAGPRVGPRGHEPPLLPAQGRPPPRGRGLHAPRGPVLECSFNTPTF